VRLSSFRIGLICILAFAVSLGIVASANAEHPGWALPGKPGISGEARVGATLTGQVGQLACQPECTHTTDEWLSCTGASSGGADRPPGAHNDENQRAPGCVVRPASGPGTYVVRPEDAGRYIQFHATAHSMDCGQVRSDGTQECGPSQGHGYSPTVGPIAAAPVTPPPPATPPPAAVAAPRNTALPTITGEAVEGETLTASPGSWEGNPTFAYQWLRCSTALKGCQDISGATEVSYQLVRSDVGARLIVRVTARNAGGSSVFHSARTAKVAAASGSTGGQTSAQVVSVQSLGANQQLAVGTITGPRIIRTTAGIVLRVAVRDSRGLLVRGAIVEAFDSAGATVPVKRTTGSRGVAVLRIKPESTDVPSRLTLTIIASKSAVDPLVAAKRVVLRSTL
jgi:hypothetical protein